MEAAINSAIIQMPADPSEVAGSCSSGNCTFPTYGTLGVCSKLDDVTPTIVHDCHHEDTGATSRCFYTVTELQVNPPYRWDNFSTDDPQMTLWVGAPGNMGSLDLNSLGQFYTIYLPDTKGYGSQANITEELVALKAELYLCIISYQTNVTNGITKTVEVDRATNLTWQRGFDNNDASFISTTSDGKRYWMYDNSTYAFWNYLTLDVFHGHGEMNGFVDGEIGTTDAASTLAGLLVDKKGGQGAVSKMLENLAISMTNA